MSALLREWQKEFLRLQFTIDLFLAFLFLAYTFRPSVKPQGIEALKDIRKPPRRNKNSSLCENSMHY